jgi:NAD(P)H-dependent FMN reductase
MDFPGPHTMSPGPRIVVVAASPSPRSRSRIAARFVAEQIEECGATVAAIDLLKDPVDPYPGRETDAHRTILVGRFREADGVVLAAPVYNWGPSSHLLNFLHYALEGEGRRYRPFLLIAGAGGVRSHLAFDGLGRTVVHEEHAVLVGPPVLVAGDDADIEAERLTPELEERLRTVSRVLVTFSRTSAQLNQLTLQEGWQ